MALDYFNSFKIVFKCFQTQTVMTQYSIVSLSLSVISEPPIYLSLPVYQNSWLGFRSKSFSKISSARRFLRLFKIMARAEHWFYPCHTRSDQLFSFL